MCKITEAEDIMADARNLVEAAYMASDSLAREQAGPLTTLLAIAAKKLEEAIDLLREHRAESVTAASDLLPSEIPSGLLPAARDALVAYRAIFPASSWNKRDRNAFEKLASVLEIGCH